MSYVNYTFLLFLICSLAIYFTVPSKLRKYILLTSSIIFYSFAGLDDFLFVLVAMCTTFFAALSIENIKDREKRKYVLVITILLNLAILIFLKFGNFSLSLLEQILQVDTHIELGLWMPLGISFYTLQVISYIVDVYRRKIKAEHHILKYATFVFYFPTILQGPITRYHDMANQLWRNHSFSFTRVKYGGQLMVWGLFKKLVIANHLAVYVDSVFQDHYQYSGMIVLVACIFYTFQIYTDFSGCVDICRGISQMYGITLQDNFDHPYFATSIKDFWRRWHISLSSWFRDYIYIPLGGNKKGTIYKYRNILIVFFVSGLWHGVGYHFLVWGLLHGLFQVLGDLLSPLKKRIASILHYPLTSRFHRTIQQIITFLFVSFAWVFFRAINTNVAIEMLSSIPNHFFEYGNLYNLGVNSREFKLIIISLLILWIVSSLQQHMKIRERIARLPLPIRWGIYLVALYSIIIFGAYGSGFDASSFIYMQF